MRRLLEHIQTTGTIHMQPCVFPGLDRWLYMGTAQLYSPQGMILRNILREGDDTHRHSYYHEPGMHIGHRMSVLHTGAIPRRGRVAGVAIVPAAAVASSPVPAPRRSPRLAAGSDSDSSDSDDDHRVPAAGSISIVYADDSDSSSSDEDMPDAVVEEVAEALAAEAEAVEEAEVAAPAAEEEAPAPAEADSPAPYRPSSPTYRPTSPVGMGGSAAEATPPVEDGPHHSRSTSAASAFSWTPMCDVDCVLFSRALRSDFFALHNITAMSDTAISASAAVAFFVISGMLMCCGSMAFYFIFRVWSRQRSINRPLPSPPLPPRPIQEIIIP
ncbi:hypothetical protein JZU56_02290, partial [bacterium]|nr:hypothetical protein [bacterium]